MPRLELALDVEASLAAFDDRAQYTQVYNGVDMWKTVDDLKRYELVIERSRPELVVETGTRWGGFAHWLAGRHGLDVVTVDVNGIEFGRTFPRVTSIAGNSARASTVRKVAELAAGRRTMVVLDSDHHAPHVEAEIRAYGPLVTSGCYLVVEDGLADLADERRARRFGTCIPESGGPLAAVEAVLAGAVGWVRDLEVEYLTAVTHHPGGWWRRA